MEVLFECRECAQEFTPRRIDAVYCSNVCGNRHRNRKWKEGNPDKVRAGRFEYNSNDQRRIYTRVKSRAKQQGIEFDLTPDDIIIPEVCPVLGIEIKSQQGRGHHPNSPSVDRIDPKKGYVKGNVRVISGRANLLKSDATVEELELVLEDLKCLR